MKSVSSFQQGVLYKYMVDLNIHTEAFEWWDLKLGAISMGPLRNSEKVSETKYHWMMASGYSIFSLIFCCTGIISLRKALG